MSQNQNNKPFKAFVPSEKLTDRLKDLIKGYGDGLGKLILSLQYFSFLIYNLF